jgi:ketosteroid isomerase-like protein
MNALLSFQRLTAGDDLGTPMKYPLFIFALLLAGSATKADEKKLSPAETAIIKVLRDQVTAWNKSDLAEFMNGYWKSKDLTFYAGKDKQLGWAQTFERYKKRYQSEGKEMGQLSFAEFEVQVLSPEFALVKGRWHVKMKKETLEGLFTLVMKKTDQGWVIVHDHTSAG